MDIRSNSTMMIALAIAVVVVTGVMVPVISDTIDNAGSGGGGGSSAQPYVNEGEIYLKSAEGYNTTIRITSNENDVVITKDGTVLETLQKGGESWGIPILMCTETYDGDLYKELITVNYWVYNSATDGTTSYTGIQYYSYNVNDYYLNSYSIYNGEYVEIITNNGEAYLTFYYDDDSTEEWDPLPFDALISEDGEWVWAEAPVVSSSSEIIMYGYDSPKNITEESQSTTRYINYSFWGMGVGTYSEWTQNVDTPKNILVDNDYSELNWSTDADSGTMYLLDWVYAIDSEANDYGYRLNSISLTTVWAQRSGNVVHVGPDYTDVYTKFLVPKTVKAGGETQAGWLTKDMPSEQITISCREVETGKMAVYYNQWDYYAEHGEYPEPIYIQDMTENPILVLAIGETWAAYIDTLPSNLDDPYQGEQGKIRFGGGYVFTFSLKINPNGTASYKNNAEIEGQTITKSDLIAYISPNGNLVPYYNENAPKSNTLYSFFAYMNAPENIEDDEVWINAILSNGYNSPTVHGMGTKRTPDSFYESESLSATYTTNGYYVTGMNITVTYPSESTEYNVSFTGQTPPEPYDIAWPPEISGDMIYSVAFSVVESGTEETSGGGSGGLSPTLVTVLSIIPIMVLVGLVLMAVRSMKV